MKLRLVINIIFLLGINLLIKPIWVLGIDVQVQNHVGNQIYGNYQALLNLTVIFAMLLDMGLQTFNQRQVASAPNTFHGLFPNILIAKLILALIYMSIISLSAYFLNYRGPEIYLLFLLGILQITVSFLLYARSNISALQRFNLDSTLSILDKVIAIVLTGYYLYFSPNKEQFSISHFVIFQIIGYAVTLIIALSLNLHLFKFKWRGIQLNRVFAIVRQGLPYALLVFFMGIYARSDMVLIDSLLSEGSEESGIYAACFRLLDLSNNMVGVLMAGILMPLFVNMLAKRVSLHSTLNLVSHIMMAASFFIVLWVYFYGDQIVEYLYDHGTNYTVEVLKVLIWVFPISSLSYIFSTLLTAAGKIRFLVKSAFVAGLLSVLINIWMIPHYGAFGAAIVSIITHGIFVALVLMKVKSEYHFKWPIKFIIKKAAWVILLFLLFYFTQQYFDNQWVLASFVTGVAALVSLFFMGGISIKQLRELLIKEK